MKAEHENSNEPRVAGYQPGRDRLDWISKYLELADKVMQDRPLEPSQKSGQS
jgi:hypothetical protein